MEILSSAFCCPKTESTFSKIYFGAAQQRMLWPALPVLLPPCWTPPLQCRSLLLRQGMQLPALSALHSPFGGYCHASAQFISQCSGVVLFGLCTGILHLNQLLTHTNSAWSICNNSVCALIQFLIFCSASCLSQDSSNKRQLFSWLESFSGLLLMRVLQSLTVCFTHEQCTSLSLPPQQAAEQTFLFCGLLPPQSTSVSKP